MPSVEIRILPASYKLELEMSSSIEIWIILSKIVMRGIRLSPESVHPGKDSSRLFLGIRLETSALVRESTSTLRPGQSLPVYFSDLLNSSEWTIVTYVLGLAEELVWSESYRWLVIPHWSLLCYLIWICISRDRHWPPSLAKGIRARIW